MADKLEESLDNLKKIDELLEKKVATRADTDTLLDWLNILKSGIDNADRSLRSKKYKASIAHLKDTKSDIDKAIVVLKKFV